MKRFIFSLLIGLVFSGGCTTLPIQVGSYWDPVACENLATGIIYAGDYNDGVNVDYEYDEGGSRIYTLANYENVEYIFVNFAPTYTDEELKAGHGSDFRRLGRPQIEEGLNECGYIFDIEGGTLTFTRQGP